MSISWGEIGVSAFSVLASAGVSVYISKRTAKAEIEKLEQDLIDGKFDIPQIRLETDNTKWEEIKASVQ